MLDQPVWMLTLALFLALGTERLIELFRALADHLEARYGSFTDWHRMADKIRRSIEVGLRTARADSLSAFQMALFIACRHLGPAPAGSAAGSLAVDVAYVRKTVIRLRCKLVGIGVGVFFAYVFDLNIFALVGDQLTPAEIGQESIGPIQACLQILVTGIAMGLGAGPMHSLITALERARKNRI